MSITGNLKTMEPPDLLQWISERQKTGALVVDNGKVSKRIFFRQGKIASSSSSDPKEYLSHLLISHGLISEAELAEAFDRRDSERDYLGEYLVREKKLSEVALSDLLRLKTEEAIFDMFSWEQGEFVFHDDETLGTKLAELALNVTSLTLQGARRLDEWERIREIVPSRYCIPVTVGELVSDKASERDKAVLELVNDNRSIHEICLETRSSEFFVCDVLVQQVRAKRLKVVRPPEAGASSVEGLIGTGVPVLDSDNLLRVADKHLADEAYETSLRYYRAARSLEPESETLKQRVEAAEKDIQEGLEKAGIVPSAVPRLERPFESLASLRLSPEAGFILSRINGTYDIESIFKITPMPPLDTGLLVLRLLEAGHISIDSLD